MFTSTNSGVRTGVRSVLVGSALGAGATAAGADVVPGTEDGWGQPPGDVTLSVLGDDGSGNHLLTVTWGPIDPFPGNGGYWNCEVDERFTPPSDAAYPLSVSKANFDVKLDPPTGGRFEKQVSEAPGERISLSMRCSTVFPGAFATTPPAPAFGWKFDYQLRWAMRAEATSQRGE